MGTLARALAAAHPSALAAPPLWTVFDVRLVDSDPRHDRYIWQALVTAADGSSGAVKLHEFGWETPHPEPPSSEQVRTALEPHTPDNDADSTWVWQLQHRLIVLS